MVSSSEIKTQSISWHLCRRQFRQPLSWPEPGGGEAKRMREIDRRDAPYPKLAQILHKKRGLCKMIKDNRQLVNWQ